MLGRVSYWIDRRGLGRDEEVGPGFPEELGSESPERLEETFAPGAAQGRARDLLLTGGLVALAAGLLLYLASKAQRLQGFDTHSWQRDRPDMPEISEASAVAPALSER
jgi:hypothetical protein